MRNVLFRCFLFMACVSFELLAHTSIVLAGGEATIEINPNLPGPNPSDNPAGLVANAYQFALLLGGVLAFGAIVYGGIRYTVAAGNPSGQSEGKEWVKGALWGLLLLAGATLILNTLNPSITKLALPTLKPLQAPAPGVSGVGVAGGLTHADALAQLQAAKINTTGIQLGGIQQSTIDELIRLKRSCGCDVVVTSVTGGQHASGQCSHANGFKADLRINLGLDNYIKNNCGFIGNRTTDQAPQYRCSGGGIYARESNPPHWDMKVGC